MGFEPFLFGPPSRCVSTSIGPPRLSLVRSSHPSKRSPFWKPRHVTVTVAISLLHCLLFPAASAQPHGFAPPESPLPLACVSTCFRPDAPLGFVPLQGAPLAPSAHWTVPELCRRSGSTLDHVHRSDRILDLANACASARLAEASQSQLPAPRGAPSATSRM